MKSVFPFVFGCLLVGSLVLADVGVVCAHTNSAGDPTQEEATSEPNDSEPNDSEPNDSEPNDSEPNDSEPNDSEHAKSVSNATVDEEKPVETVVAEIKPIVVYESFRGIFESIKTHEVKTDFDNWTDLVIETAVEEGAAVSAGDVLLKFETESIDKAIAEAEFAVRNLEFDFQNAQLAMKQADETFELENAAAERAWENAQEDYDYYHKIQLPQRLDDLAYSEKSASYYLEYSKDELDQLEQMYNEDELTEESEALVLKRAQRDVESAQRSLDRTLTRLQREKETEIPREKIEREDALKRELMNHAKAMITLPVAKQKAEIALAQAEFALENKQQLLEKLKTDHSKMTLTAPADGVVYFGICERGKWSAPTGAGSRNLEAGKKLAANTVVMTLVDISQQTIRATVEEKSLVNLTPRMRGKALIIAAGNRTIPVLLKSVSRIPIEEGKFDAKIMIETLPVDASVMPGMTCKISFLVQENKQAIVLPKSSVFSDDDGVTNFVYRMIDGKPKRTEVLVGHTVSDDTEIIEGLASGDEVRKAKP